MDLKAQLGFIRNELVESIGRVLSNADFVLGDEVVSFEREFADYCKARYAVGVNSGTSALHLSLRAMDIGTGDAIMTVPNTFFATAEAISYNGATPIFVDVDPLTYNMGPLKLEEKLSIMSPAERVREKAVIPVHLFGQPAEMDAILEVAKRYNLFVVEDACQAHGAEYKGQKVGALGDAGCYSFYPSKNLGACGEGGMVVTNNSELANRITILRDHGQDRKHHHQSIGYNARLESLQAAILRVKLKYLDQWIEKRRKLASIYAERLDGQHIITPCEDPKAKHVYHLYVVRHERRSALMDYLKARNIGSALHYPVLIPAQKAYAHLGYRRGDFPVAEACADQVLSLPMFPELSEAQVETVCQAIRAFLES